MHMQLHTVIFTDQHMVCAWSDLVWLECRSDIICSADVINWLQALLMLQWPSNVTWGPPTHFTAEQGGRLCSTGEQCYFLTYNWLRHMYRVAVNSDFLLTVALLDNNTPILWVKVMHLDFDRSKCTGIGTRAAELHTACSSAFFWSASIT